MLEMMNGTKEFIDKMEAETRKGPVVVGTRTRLQEWQPSEPEISNCMVVTPDGGKTQGRHVVKIRVNAGEEVGSIGGGVTPQDGPTRVSVVTPLNSIEKTQVDDEKVHPTIFSTTLSKPLVIGRTLKERDGAGMREMKNRPSKEEELSKPTLPGQLLPVNQVKEAATGRSLISSSTNPTTTTSSPEKKNKLNQFALQQNLAEISSNQSSSNAVCINVSSPPAQETMFSRNEEDVTPYYSYNHLAYLYSHNQSGQSSPASDSGTCSDWDASTPPPLPKKKSSLNKKVTNTVQLHVGNIQKHDDIKHHMVHQRKGGNSLTSSGADPESDDDISCDSLNSSELEHQVVSSSSSTSSDHLITNHHHEDLDEEDVDDGVHDLVSRRRKVHQFRIQQSSPPPLPPKKSQQKKLEEGLNQEKPQHTSGFNALETSLPQKSHTSIVEGINNIETSPQEKYETQQQDLQSIEGGFNNLEVLQENSLKDKLHTQVQRHVSVEERTYDERNSTKYRITSPNSTLSRCDSTPSSSLYDSFYKFHLNEKSELNSRGADDCSSLSSSGTLRSSVTVDGLDSFAGRKGYIQDGDVETATIRSSKGTIRGVKNRVRAGIATFLQINSNKRWEEKDAGKVVVYTTTMGTVRETYLRCLKVRQILRTNLIKFEERDAFMSREVQGEIKERMSSEVVALPQVFVEGQHLGDAETLERLNESGELRKILQPYKSPDACTTCQVCGGFRLLPCAVCNGSKKSVHRNHFTTELVALKCMSCDEVGLVRCYAC